MESNSITEHIPKRRRQNARTSNIEARTKKNTTQVSFKQPFNPLRPVDFINEEEIETIENASFDILENLGIEILNDQAAEIMRANGADVSQDNRFVRFDRHLIKEKIKTAPEKFTYYARNEEKNLQVGGNALIFALVGSTPNVSCLDKGRRPGSWEDFVNLVKLGQHINVCHSTSGYPTEPLDIHPSIRHLEAARAFLTLTDKCFHCYSLNPFMNTDSIEMARIAYNLTEEEVNERPLITSVINANSPLKYDYSMLQGIIEMSSRNQIIVITPFTLAGAMAPVSLAGAIAQQNAEGLAGLAFTQMVRPGAPVIYGAFTSNVDMKTGAPAFGTPEYTKAAIISGQFARRYKVPYRTSNVNAANIVDAQATYESQMSIWGNILGSVNLMKHSLGWMEGGLVASYEKVILDMEMLQQFKEFFEPLDISEDTLAINSIKEAGHGGHFFGTKHTQENYENAFYSPLISDWNNFENWQILGSKTATQRANEIWKKMLIEYQQPYMDIAIKEELDAFVEKRKKEGGIKTDF